MPVHVARDFGARVLCVDRDVRVLRESKFIECSLRLPSSSYPPVPNAYGLQFSPSPVLYGHPTRSSPLVAVALENYSSQSSLLAT